MYPTRHSVKNVTNSGNHRGNPKTNSTTSIAVSDLLGLYLSLITVLYGTNTHLGL